MRVLPRRGRPVRGGRGRGAYARGSLFSAASSASGFWP